MQITLMAAMEESARISRDCFVYVYYYSVHFLFRNLNETLTYSISRPNRRFRRAAAMCRARMDVPGSVFSIVSAVMSLSNLRNKCRTIILLLYFILLSFDMEAYCGNMSPLKIKSNSQDKKVIVFFKCRGQCACYINVFTDSCSL